MRYSDFEMIVSADRMRKYKHANNGDKKKAMMLYRLNLRLSQELFVVISCFEVALRNAIDRELKIKLGDDWLRNLILPDGVFYDNKKVERTFSIIKDSYEKLRTKRQYSHSKLIAEMEFGIWKYMFSNCQYALVGQSLLSIFPNRPKSTKSNNYTNSYIYNELDVINKIRNRVAHHEPICFGRDGTPDSERVRNCYATIKRLFAWMGIDSESMLYGLDHVLAVCDKIDVK